MKVMSYNSLFGGWDGEDGRRHRLQAETVRALVPDILLFQEAKHFEDAGWSRLFDVERAFDMRGFVARAPSTGQHTAVFARPGVEPLSFEPDSSHFHHAAACATFRVPGFSAPVTFLSVHLCPLGPHVREREVSYLLNRAAPDRFTLVAGDFNGLSPRDPEPPDWKVLPRHHRARYFSANAETADRTVLRRLESYGFIDIGALLGGNTEPTVPGAGFERTEFVPFRSDYFFATEALASTARAYRVVRDERTDFASDHYPIFAEFDA